LVIREAIAHFCTSVPAIENAFLMNINLLKLYNLKE
jgi:hypothetical protein